jgi:hypothetical protein
MTPSRFLVRLLVFALLLVVAVAVVNVAVDPYLVFDSPRVSGLNERKPAVATHERRMKGYDSVRRPARTLILGSSRSDIGLNPLSTGWTENDQPVYNLSLVGSGPMDFALYMQHFIASRTSEEPPRTLVIGLDFESFLHYPRTSPLPAERESKPQYSSLLVMPDGTENPHRPFQVIKEYAISTLYLDALLDSVSTIVSSIRHTGVSLDERGRTDEGAFQAAVRLNGVAGLFAQKNTETVRKYGQHRMVLDQPDGAPNPQIARIKRLIDIGNSINAEIVLFIHPAHADRMELFDHMGYWADFENWKRDIVELVDAERAAGAQVDLWDFGGFEPYIQEVVPEQRDRAARLDWFWEPAHYTSTLGDILIDRMRNRNSTTDFGTRITGANIEAHLRKVRADRDQYRIRYPSEQARISDLCESYSCYP